MSLAPQHIHVDADRLAEWTYEEFAAMSEAGVFMLRRRIELIAGKITDMSPISPPHAAAVSIINHDFTQLLGDKAWIRVQDPIDVSAVVSMPQPDIAVCVYRQDRYAFALPRPSEILFLIEVALSSLEFDRTTKRDLYAAAGVPEYWIVNLRDRQLERFLLRADGSYAVEATVFAETDMFEHALLGSVAVADLLPAAAPIPTAVRRRRVADGLP